MIKTIITIPKKNANANANTNTNDKTYITTQPFFCGSLSLAPLGLALRAHLAASENASLTPLFFLAEHSKYRKAPTFLATANPSSYVINLFCEE